MRSSTKKLLIIPIAIAVLSLSACGGSDKTDATKKNNDPTPSASPSATPTPTTDPVTPQDPAQSPVTTTPDANEDPMFANLNYSFKVPENFSRWSDIENSLIELAVLDKTTGDSINVIRMQTNNSVTSSEYKDQVVKELKGVGATKINTSVGKLGGETALVVNSTTTNGKVSVDLTQYAVNWKGKNYVITIGGPNGAKAQKTIVPSWKWKA